MATVLLEARPYRPFKSSEEYLYAMREDLAEWLNILYPELAINVDNFMDRLDTGVALCKHANNVRQAAEEYIVRRQARNKCMTRSMTSGLAGPVLALGTVHYLSVAKSGTFFARDNVSNFITWCRKSLQIFECLLFETDDLIMRKNEKHVILCLLEVARRGAKFGMLAPMLVQMERQIDREIAADNKAMGISIGCGTENDHVNNTVATGTEGNDIFDSDTDDEEEDNGPMMIYGPKPQIITNDLKSLDEMVRDLVEKCTCPSQFPMIRVSEGKYRIGDTKVLIFVRILRSHVMVRVGGGWDTLSHYLDKHDPCRCKAQHRSAVAAKLITRNNNNINGGIELHKAQVVYDRSPPTNRKQHSQQNSPSNNKNSSLSNNLSPPQRHKSRSRSPTPQIRTLSHNDSVEKEKHSSYLHAGSPSMGRRSKSPSQRRLNEFKRKQYSLDSNASTVSNTSLHQQNHAQPNLEKFENVENFKSDTINIEITGKSDNISDNGSEISDEGYRSLGVIHNKRASLHSEASNDDIDSNGRMENENGTSSDSPISELSLKATDLSSPDTLDYSTTTLEKQTNELDTKGDNSDAESDKVVSIAMNTGLRKTGFSDIIYEIESPKTLNNSKIPRSPQPPSSPQMVRRKSIDNSIVSGDKPNSSLNRKIPAYRSVRRPNPTGSLSPELGVRHQQNNTNNLNSTNNKKDGNSTWSGRGLKSRPSLNPSTYQSPQNGFNRNASTRSSMSNLTEKTNGRTRIKTTPTTSPIKTKSNVSSPLAKEILQVAGNSKNDVQILKNVQEILNKYNTKRKSLEPESKQLGGGGGGGGNGGGGGDYTDFTAQWVNNSGTVELANTAGCDVVAAPHKTQLVKQKSTLSSTDSTQSKDTSIAVSPRTTRDRRGMSKIPAPVRIPC